MERDLEASTIATILSRIEGWIAGLQLTALLLQGRRTEAEVRQFLADALGSHRYLVDYLGEEILFRQPEAVQSFLLHTCTLERLSAPLCAAVTGRGVDESAALLAFLERANLFLVPLDERGEWYRYHQLWASVLRVLLVRQLLGVLQAEHPEQAGQFPSLSVPLSQREHLILRELAAGRSTAEMAAELVVSPNTLKTQLGSLYRKLNVHSREEALTQAVRLHLL